MNSTRFFLGFKAKTTIPFPYTEADETVTPITKELRFTSKPTEKNTTIVEIL